MLTKRVFTLLCLTGMVAMTAEQSLAARVWQLQTKLNTAGGTLKVQRSDTPLQTVVGSTVFKNYTTRQQVVVTVASSAGYTISGVTQNGVTTNPGTPTYAVANINDLTRLTNSLIISFVKQQLGVTTVPAAGGTVSASSSVGYGGSLVVAVTPASTAGIVNAITVTPAGAAVVALKDSSGNTVTLPYAGAVKVDLSNVTAATTIAPAFTTATVNAGADIAAATGSPVSLNGASSGGTSVLWSQISGPSVSLYNANTATAGFTPATTGSYGFKLQVFLAGVPLASDTVQVSVYGSVTDSMRSSCQGCHTGNGMASATFANWSASTHKTENQTCISCHTTNNHNVITTASVDGSTFEIKLSTAGTVGTIFCAKCHVSGSTHKTAGMTCTTCHTNGVHNPDTTVDMTKCSSCHVRGEVIVTEWQAGPHAVVGHSTGTCQRCHGAEGAIAGADSGWTGSYSAVLKPYTSTVWRNNAPATSTAGVSCAVCHDPHTGLRVNNTIVGGVVVPWNPNQNGSNNDQYDVCTSCHSLTDNTGAQTDMYHEKSSMDVKRILVDTHYDNPATGVGLTTNVVEGYVIRATSANPCADCHNVHSADLSVQEAWANSAHAGKIAAKKAEAACAPALAWWNAKYTADLATACTDVKSVTTRRGGVDYISTYPVVTFYGKDAAGIAFYKTTGALDDAEGNGWTHYNWDKTSDTVPGDRTGRADCQRCHTSTGVMNFLNNPAGYVKTANDFSHLSGWTASSGSPQQELLYCWGCHSDSQSGVLRNPGGITNTYAGSPAGSPAVTVAYPNVGKSNVCMACHLGVEVGQVITASAGNFANLSFINSHYLTAGATVFNESGYEFAGQTYDNLGFHKTVGMADMNGTGDKGPCVTCHMTSPEGHTFEVAGSTACIKCHGGITPAVLEEAKHQFHLALEELKLALAAKGIYFYAAYPYMFNANVLTNGVIDPAKAINANAFKTWDAVYTGKGKDVMGAAFNYNLLEHDPGAYAHNKGYALKLIKDSIDFLADGVVDGQGVSAGFTSAVRSSTFNVETTWTATAHPSSDPGVCVECHTPAVSTSIAGAHAITGKAAASSVSFAASGSDLVMSFNVKLDGANATGFTTVAGEYAFNTPGATTTELGAVVIADNGSGNYSATLPGAAASGNTRYMLNVKNAAGTKVVVFGDYPASPVADLVGDADCTNCHGSSTIHDAYLPVPFNAKACVVCHDGSYHGAPQLAGLLHGIHNSHNRPSGHYSFTSGYGVTTEYSVTYPTYMNNCSVCHSSGLATVNASAVSYDSCMSCHENFTSFDHGITVFGGTEHAAYNAATDCSECHAADTAATMHNGLLTERSGLIYNGEDVSVVEGAKVAINITGTSRTTNNLNVTWTATYDGNPVNPCNATVAVGAPIFHAGGNADTITGKVAGNLSIIRGFFQKDDIVSAGIGTSPGQPLSTNLQGTGAATTTCNNNVATTVIPLGATEIATTATKGIVGFQGKAQVKLPYTFDNPLTPEVEAKSVIQVRSKSPTKEFNVADGTPATTTRREIVDTASCLKCHPGSLYQHGGNRIDNNDLCVICHNEASTEQNVRLLDGVSASEAYDGKPGMTYGFKSLLHAVHSAGENEAITMCYRTNGNYVWAGHNSVVPNYPTLDVFSNPLESGMAALIYGSSAPHGTGPQTVGTPGSPPAARNSDGTVTMPSLNYVAGTQFGVFRVHNLHQTTYPQTLNNCMACHKPNTYGFPDPTKAVATTLDAGTVGLGGTAPNQTASNAINSNLLDDTLQGPSAAACFSCHQAEMKPPAFHGNVGGFAPTTFNNGRADVPAESCTNCHN